MSVRARPKLFLPALLAFAGSMVLHWIVGLQYRADPFFETYLSDALSYHQWGLRIAASGIAAEPVFHQSPLFPLLLGALYRFGQSAGAVLFVQALLDSLAVAALVVVGRVYFRSTAAGVAAAAVALAHGPLVFHGLKLLPVPLALATQTTALAALGGAARCRAHWPAALAGVALGLAHITRSETLLFLPVALGFLLVTSPGRGGRLRAALLLAGAALVIAPVTAHNIRRGDLVLVASSAGENLFIGNQRGADGGHTPLHPQAGDLFSQRALAEIVAEEASGGGSLDPSEVSRYWRKRALEEIRADPLAWLGLELRKLVRIAGPGDPADMYSYPLERRRYLWTLFLLPLPPWGVWLLAIAGGRLAWRRLRGDTWPVAALVGVHLLTLLVFFVSTRLRLPLLFLLAPFAGLAVVEGWRRWRERRSRPTVASLAVVVALLSLADVVSSQPSDREVVRLASVLSRQERAAESLDVLRPLIERPHPSAVALDQAGWVLWKSGDPEAAVERYVEALAADPGDREAQIRSRLALAYEGLGRLAEAAAAHDAAIACRHASAGTYYERAKFRIKRGDRAGAIADLRQAARLDPRWTEPREALRSLGEPLR